MPRPLASCESSTRSSCIRVNPHVFLSRSHWSHLTMMTGPTVLSPTSATHLWPGVIGGRLLLAPLLLGLAISSALDPSVGCPAYTPFAPSQMTPTSTLCSATRFYTTPPSFPSPSCSLSEMSDTSGRGGGGCACRFDLGRSRSNSCASLPLQDMWEEVLHPLLLPPAPRIGLEPADVEVALGLQDSSAAGKRSRESNTLRTCQPTSLLPEAHSLCWGGVRDAKVEEERSGARGLGSLAGAYACYSTERKPAISRQAKFEEEVDAEEEKRRTRPPSPERRCEAGELLARGDNATSRDTAMGAAH
ncbi:hypothetical protein B0H13DRAFT_2306073 [Mycena leptocephala]|nr:hypothetical protein B0H13DRAFT_2306073 [Mycena leptocephala]